MIKHKYIRVEGVKVVGAWLAQCLRDGWLYLKMFVCLFGNSFDKATPDKDACG